MICWSSEPAHDVTDSMMSSMSLTTSGPTSSVAAGNGSGNESTGCADDDDYCYIDPESWQRCELYNFVMYAVIGGSLCLLGCVGNILAFVVFWCDKVKTSTSLLFQVPFIYNVDTACHHHIGQQFHVLSFGGSACGLP